MKTRRDLLEYILLFVSTAIAAIFASACGRKPDAETEPSPEWPPKDE